MRKPDLVALLTLVCAAGGIAVTQLPARTAHSKLRETSEAYLLPPPDQLIVGSLGHRAALADLLWAKVLVSQGERLMERRRFETIVPYIEAINALDPKWRDPYRMSDALITLQTVEPVFEDVIAARRILERGVAERPTDAELWLILGQYVSYIAPYAYIKDEALSARWREEGAEYLLRAAELAGKDSDFAWQAIGAGGIFARAGKIDRQVELYQKVLATTDDPELKKDLTEKLERLGQQKGETERSLQLEQRKMQREAFERMWRESYPATPLTSVFVMGVPRDAAKCAGGQRAKDAESPTCAPSWTEWFERSVPTPRD